MKETLPGLGVDPPAAVEGVELLAPPADGVDLVGRTPARAACPSRGGGSGPRQASPRRLTPSGIAVPGDGAWWRPWRSSPGCDGSSARGQASRATGGLLWTVVAATGPSGKRAMRCPPATIRRHSVLTGRIHQCRREIVVMTKTTKGQEQLGLWDSTTRPSQSGGQVRSAPALPAHRPTKPVEYQELWDIDDLAAYLGCRSRRSTRGARRDTAPRGSGSASTCAGARRPSSPGPSDWNRVSDARPPSLTLAAPPVRPARRGAVAASTRATQALVFRRVPSGSL